MKNGVVYIGTFLIVIRPFGAAWSDCRWQERFSASAPKSASSFQFMPSMPVTLVSGDDVLRRSCRGDGAGNAAGLKSAAGSVLPFDIAVLDWKVPNAFAGRCRLLATLTGPWAASEAHRWERKRSSGFSAHVPGCHQRLNFLEQQVPVHIGEPFLADEEWRALKEICKTS
ncbi:hypothetical protein ACFOYU_19635 [Microvirga sp. GCM10011540]|uniref:hypothetical protein n=1 Tax=Microvirga sp. GCM10011540 TaxID=3317338 RepID=UPI00361552AB